MREPTKRAAVILAALLTVTPAMPAEQSEAEAAWDNVRKPWHVCLIDHAGEYDWREFKSVVLLTARSCHSEFDAYIKACTATGRPDGGPTGCTGLAAWDGALALFAHACHVQNEPEACRRFDAATKALEDNKQ